MLGAPAWTVEVVHEITREGVDQIVTRSIGGDEHELAVVGELDPSPAFTGPLTMRLEALLDVEEVEGSERWLVVVPKIVKMHRLRRGRGNRDDGRARIIGSEPRKLEVQLALRIGAPAVPELDGIIERGREEVVAARRQTQTRHAIRVSSEIAYEAVIVHGQVPYAIVDFCAGVDDGSGVVREACEGAAVLLTLQLFRMRTSFRVEELDGVVGPTEEEELPAVVEIDRGVVRALRGFEEPRRSVVFDHLGHLRRGRWRHLRHAETAVEMVG